MMFTVPELQNICYIFELPERFSSDYCFGGGIPTNFQMVDWFNPVPPPEMHQFDSWEDLRTGMLNEFLLAKNYVKPGRQYLAITGFGEVFLFQKEAEE